MDFLQPHLVFQALAGAWLVFEVVLVIRRRSDPQRDRNADAGTARTLWLVIGLSLLASGGSQLLPVPRLPAEFEVRIWTGCALLALGLMLRWHAIRTLGRMFTVNVAIREGHRLIEEGPYRFVRHPSYTGLFVIFVGCGVALGNWLSLALAIVPPTMALVHRIRVEERALADGFPGPFKAYAARTSRLIPWVY